MSSLFLASVEGGRIWVNSGITNNAMITACRPMEMTWVHPKFSSLDQMSFTLTGLLVHCAGACLTGKNNSLIRVPNPPKPAPQATSSLLLDGPLGTGPDFKTVFRFSVNPSP